MMVCSVSGCGRKQKGHGLCDTHLRQRHVTAARQEGHRLHDDAVDRFWHKVERRDDGGCWLWTGTVDKNGYGIFRSRYFNHRAHRVAYQLEKGEIPAGFVVMHSCDTPGCCNPAHLSVGTHADNIADRDAKGRTAKGETHPRRINPDIGARGEQVNTARLTETDVVRILERLNDGATLVGLAREYGISNTAVRYIQIGRNWKHVRRPDGFADGGRA